MAGESIWTYNPSYPLTIVAAALYAIPMFIQGYQTIFRYRTYYFIPVLIGAVFEVAGYAVRAVATKQLDQIPPYAVQSALIILAPIFIGAGDYLLVSRLCVSVLPPNQTHIYGLSTRKLTRIFVTCDIISFLIQVSGSGIASSGNWEGSNATTGTNVMIAGLATQLGTFAFFMLVLGRFHQLANKGTRGDAPEGWRKMVQAVYVSSALIIVRSIYRLVEFALGIDGYPFKNEWMFYIFEALPMLPALSIFCVYHPAKYLPTRKSMGGISLNSPLVSSGSV